MRTSSRLTSNLRQHVLRPRETEDEVLDEFRDPVLAQQLVDRVRATSSRQWVLMDVCGGQTHSLLRYGIEQALQGSVEFLHGPGCPVCVTAVEAIDFARQLCMLPGVTLTSFGDMLRVPGSRGSLLDARARGGRVKAVYSPLDVVRLAQAAPQQQFVFFAVGFETTAPATALAVLQAQELGLDNLSLLQAHVRVLPAMQALMLDPDCRVQGFLAAGHVCTITGSQSYQQFVERFRVPVAVAGFEALDLLQAVLEVVQQLERGQAAVVNCYARTARGDGNPQAMQIVEQVYQVADRCWRGFGMIEGGGLELRDEFKHFDAQTRYPQAQQLPLADPCPSADVMSGAIRPAQCPHFGSRCTPEHPLGAPMVSSEGVCAAYIRHCIHQPQE